MGALVPKSGVPAFCWLVLALAAESGRETPRFAEKVDSDARQVSFGPGLRFGLFAT